MAARHKRKLVDVDPTASDPEDLDYGAEASPPRRPRSKPSKNSSPRKQPSSKRRRETYGDSDDDIELDSNVSSEQEESFGSSGDESAVLNPRTGRGVRSVAKKPIKYEESSEEDEPAVTSDSDRDPLQPTPVAPKTKRPDPRATAKRESRIVTLNIPFAMVEGRVTRARPGSRGNPKRGSTPQSALGTRRSSRISHDENEALVALTNSGRHEQITRASATPEPSSASRRPTRGGKGIKKPPSAIYEVSNEDLAGADAAEVEDNLVLGLKEYAGPDKTEKGNVSEQGTARVANVSKEEDIRMEGEEEEEDEPVVQESQPEPEAEADDQDEDEGPIRATRASRKTRYAAAESPPPAAQSSNASRRTLRNKKSATEPSSDFEPDADAEADADADEDVSDTDELQKPGRGRSSNEGSATGRRSGRLARKNASQRSRSRRHESEEADAELDPDEIADEAAELDEDNRRNRRGRRREPQRTEITFEPNLRNRNKRPDYRIFRPELVAANDDDDAPGAAAATPQRNRRGGAANTYRSLFSTFGPFGGGGGPAPVFGGPEGTGALGGVDSDSSDDEGAGRGGQNVGGAIGMTPSSAFPKPFVPQALNADPVQGPGGGPPGLGKVKDKKALADADPLGVDTNVNFDGVGGLDGHINQLKEMIMLPLLYPEVFQRFHVTPPRGVLFHGPPGTGKTLLARALASSVSSQGQKVTFYMRKGADALSKWVGEAERQLRLLFEEARKTQPSIIFFDEIDGLAPVRSSKQEQIHASIVATLLALMDGMDGRGQVIVIGATNRPDSVDPALRRPGRFDREFYFPLPDQIGRRKIIDIHTKGWDPPLKSEFKDQLAEVTRGYGGADLRALCTEAALNAVQGTYPQIYSSEQKLIIDPSTIKVLAKDFMISVNKIVPSSERSAASAAAPLKKDVEPLLRKPLAAIAEILDEIIPRKRKATALEEAMYDDRDDEFGFEKETMQREFEASRIFRPRLLIKGPEGMGQQYLGAALLSKFEGLHVQNFDLPTLLKDSTRSPEAAIVQLFEEVKRHKPSVIYIPNVDIWYETLADTAIRTFVGLLRSLPPTDPVLLLGIMNSNDEETDPAESASKIKMMRELFGYSSRNQFNLHRPDEAARREFFGRILDLVCKQPSEFPDLDKRKRRKLEQLPIAPVAEQPKGPGKAELKAQKKKDRLTLNMLKLHIQQVMDQIKLKYKKFRLPIVDESILGYLYDEQDPQTLTTDLDEVRRQKEQLFRPYELDKDEKGVGGLREQASGKFYYNLEIVTIEKRLSNGYYKRPADFLADIKRLAKDAKEAGDQDRTLKANEMLANVEVDMMTLEQNQASLVAECEAVYQRELERDRLLTEKIKAAGGGNVPRIVANVPPPVDSKQTTQTTGPVVLGQEIPGRPPLFPTTPSKFPTIPNEDAWSNANGSHPSHQTNGFSVPSRTGDAGNREDSEMYDTSPAAPGGPEPSSHPQSGQSQPWPHPAPQQQGSGIDPAGFSQHSAHTRIAQGSQLAQYQNSASTTTSGQKASTDRTSNQSSGPFSGVNTEVSNGVSLHTQHPHHADRHSNNDNNGRSFDHPDFSIMNPHGGSELPDTQEPSLPSQLSQQVMAPPSSRTPRTSGGSGSGSSGGGGGGGGGALNPISALLNKPDDQEDHHRRDAHTMDVDVDDVDVDVDDAFFPSSAAKSTTPNKPDPPPPSSSNSSSISHDQPPVPSQPFLLPSSATLQNSLSALVANSTGLSLEQLEQINATIMHIIWKDRSLGDRNILLDRVFEAFNATLRDIRACQAMRDPNWTQNVPDIMQGTAGTQGAAHNMFPPQALADQGYVSAPQSEDPPAPDAFVRGRMLSASAAVRPSAGAGANVGSGRLGSSAPGLDLRRV